MKDEKKILKEDSIVRDFKLSSAALKNKNTVFLITFVLIVFGIISYQSLPKELFPEIVFPNIMVQTMYPGNPPIDIENLITRPLEKEIEGVTGLKTLSSTSSSDISFIFAEFNPSVNIEDALEDVKEAVDKAKSDLPNDMLSDPLVLDIDVSEFPIININLSGDYSLDELKEYAEYLEDEIEGIYEISKVDIKGLNAKEIQIDVNPHQMEAFEVGFRDIENAITQENISMSGGEVKLGDTRQTIRVIGEFKTLSEIENIIVKDEKGNIVYLRELATVTNGYAEPKSFTRLNGKSVVSLQVIKKSGENLLYATEKINEVLSTAKKKRILPENLQISLTNDQSDQIKSQLKNLWDSMLIGMIFVILVLFFFLGTRNALFVGLAIPMSMLLSFVILGVVGAKINMIILFALILALGMLVDNAIVVVENIYRFIDKGYPILKAARQATGEIAMPIISSTATTLVAFLPLMFWDGIVGEFMFYLPLTLIIVLTSSLIVALVIIPVFSSSFIKGNAETLPPNKKRALIIIGVSVTLALLFYLGNQIAIANVLMLIAIITFLNLSILFRMSQWFQNVFLSWLENLYLRILTFAIRRKNPVWLLLGTIGLFIFVIVLMGIRKPNVVFFPPNDPQYLNIIASLPISTDITGTNTFSYKLESKVNEILKDDSLIVKSVLVTVGEGAHGEEELIVTSTPHRILVTITFIDYDQRGDKSSIDIFKKLSRELIGYYPGVTLSIDKNRMGPPTGMPINLEITGADFDKLIRLSDTILQVIDREKIDGIEGMKIDLDLGKPQLTMRIDREKARRFGLSTIQIAGTVRNSLFGKEISDFKIGEEEYPIMLRFAEEYKYNMASLMNQKITFRNNMGEIMQVPVSAVAEVEYGTTYGAVKRKNMDRSITLASNVIEGYNANTINDHLKRLMKDFDMPDEYKYKFTGEQEEQAKSSDFLMRALLMSVSFIILILVAQFNSIIKPFIIMGSVVLSTIGVIGGIATFKMDFVIIMTGIGIISLAGVVVNNAIVLMDYINLLKNRKETELELPEGVQLSMTDHKECIVQGGKTRLRPVLLTAITTILGLFPMAIGININFSTLLSDFNPHIYLGGDMASFWSSMAWTVIFGLTFATFLTLIIVPVLYKIVITVQYRFAQRKARKSEITRLRHAS